MTVAVTASGRGPSRNGWIGLRPIPGVNSRLIGSEVPEILRMRCACLYTIMSMTVLMTDSYAKLPFVVRCDCGLCVRGQFKVLEDLGQERTSGRRVCGTPR